MTKLEKLDKLKTIVCNHYETDITFLSRNRKRVDGRMLFSKILREDGFGLSEIGKYLKRHHTTILHYEKEADYLIEYDKNFKESYIRCKGQYDDSAPKEYFYTKRELLDSVLKLKKEKYQLELTIIKLKNTVAMRRNEYLKHEELFDLIKSTVTDKNKELVKDKMIAMFNTIANQKLL